MKKEVLIEMLVNRGFSQEGAAKLIEVYGYEGYSNPEECCNAYAENFAEEDEETFLENEEELGGDPENEDYARTNEKLSNGNYLVFLG